VLRGYIYALGGVFNGTVYAKEGVFNGIVNATGGLFRGTIEAQDGFFHGFVKGVVRDISSDNIDLMLIPDSSEPMPSDLMSFSSFFIDFDKTGLYMRFVGTFTQSVLSIKLPQINNADTEQERDKYRTLTNSTVVIYNMSNRNIQISYNVIDSGSNKLYKESLIKPNMWATAKSTLGFANVEGETINWDVSVYEYWK
jgi:hypothetical protein